MTEHPIIFSGESIKAILEGRKTMTRRVIKPQPYLYENLAPVIGEHIVLGTDYYWEYKPGIAMSIHDAVKMGKCPYGIPGDHLWVKETLKKGHVTIGMGFGKDVVVYQANNHYHPEFFWKWKKNTLSARFMPRWASRITLEIINIRVERVQEISRNDALAEGIEINPSLRDLGYSEGRTEFKHLWDSINAKRGCGWDKNPWVWCISFRRL
jgi:hypothetical protein